MGQGVSREPQRSVRRGGASKPGDSRSPQWSCLGIIWICVTKSHLAASVTKADYWARVTLGSHYGEEMAGWLGQWFRWTGTGHQNVPCPSAAVSLSHPSGVLAGLGVVGVIITGKCVDCVTNHFLSSGKSWNGDFVLGCITQAAVGSVGHIRTNCRRT